jgi:hypothetical protein
MVALPKIIDKDLGYAALFRRAREIESSTVTVGIIGDAANESDGDLTVAEYGAVNEFGTDDGHIPARPFLRPTFDAERERLMQVGQKLIGAVIDGKMTTDQALGILGADLASKVKARITSHVPPPNAPSTVARKGSDKTLIDTGRLLNAISWSVEVKE